MKTIGYFLVAFTVLCAGTDSVCASTRGSDDTLIEDIRASARAFEKAIVKRNFKLAKEELGNLFPLMKKELKHAKKQIHELVRNGEDGHADKAGRYLKRKIAIHDQLHVISEASTAALRVKAEDARALVKEYIGLLADYELLSSVNE